MTNKYHSDATKPISSYQYAPAINDTGNKASTPRNIVATSEASGVGNADFSSALTMAMPTDSRIIIDSWMSRISITTDAFTCAHLYCRVYVDAQDASHRLFDLDITAIGNSLAVSACNSTTLPSIFALFSDGAAHTFYFFFWVNAAAANLTLTQLWKSYGSKGSMGGGDTFMHINFSGQMSIGCYWMKLGSGAAYMLACPSSAHATAFVLCTASLGNYSCGSVLPSPLVDTPQLRFVNFATQTDMLYLQAMAFIFHE